MSIRIESGRKAKLDGHKKEDVLSKTLTEINGSLYYTDGGSKTKRDIINDILEQYISLKSFQNRKFMAESSAAYYCTQAMHFKIMVYN